MSKAPSKARSTEDAIQLLKADHRVVEELFAAFESATSNKKKESLARQICMELSIHATIEEEIFYPAVREAVEADDLDEAYVEHDGAKLLIAEIMAGSPGDDFYDAKVTVLSEEIKHHVKEEEGRGGIFAQAKKAGVDLAELGAQLAKRKKTLVAEYKKSGTPPPVYRTMTGAEVTLGETVG